ncbi:hypothetical protein CcaverHIS002_0304630 [Cutaneotrichosporon cavernicola]|nr:hypothetical protein CcaverHIS002_0304630 [Cutaneotrichosporon cavernicola]BEI98165.1 hypothetical protein CcaverHIS631_0304640 [Cutaneotrichosporon cavernicola]
MFTATPPSLAPLALVVTKPLGFGGGSVDSLATDCLGLSLSKDARYRPTWLLLCREHLRGQLRPRFMHTQSTSTAVHPGHLGQHSLNPIYMYPNSSAHQRNTASPRAYEAGAAGAQNGDDQYNYQAAGFGGLSGYNYQSQMGMYNTSPQLPSGSRRTSNPKASPTQPASATATTSPSAYYPRQTQQADVTQSPYQQNAQPHLSQQYGGYYPHYDQYGGHHPSQWQQSYSAQSNFGQQRQSSSGSMPTGATASTNDAAQSSRASGGSFDYSTSQGQQQQQQQYQNWDPSRQAQGHQWAQQASAQQPSQQQQASSQGSSQQRSGGSSAGQQANVVNSSPWQGYGAGAHQPFPPPPQPVTHLGGQMPPGQYSGGWQQWQGQPGYGGYPPAQAQPTAAPPTTVPPAATTTAPPPAAAPPAPVPTTKGKKSKKEDAAAAATSPVLGKRSSDDGHDDSEKKHKTKKSKKDEAKPAPKAPTKSHLKPPRQAPSAWQLFFADELNKAKAAAAAEAGSTPGGTPIHPKLNVAQIAKDAGAAYAGLTEDRKAHYARKVEEGKVQYQKDLAAWQATLTPEDIKAENAFRAQQRKDGKSRKGNLKDPNAPKKPLSAYFLFLKGIRENDDLRKSVWAEESETTRQSVLAAERWRGLSDDEKRPYLQQAEKDKQEYEALRKIYEDDAAARQRGEAQSDRPIFKEIESAVINPPKSLLEPR